MLPFHQSEGISEWTEDAESLSSISEDLKRQYDETLDLEVLLRAVTFSEWAVAVTQVDDPNRTYYLSRSVSCLDCQYRRTKDGQVLDVAIRLAREALSCFPDNMDVPFCKVQNLAVLLEYRIDLAIERGELSRALSLAEEATSEIPKDYHDRARILGKLSFQLFLQYKQEHKECDLSEAIATGEEAVAEAEYILPPERFTVTLFLLYALESRYELHQEGKDLERLISLAEATASTDDLVRRAAINCKLAVYLRWRFDRSEGSVEDLDRIIELGKSYRDLPREAQRLESLDQLIAWYMVRFDNLGQENDLNEPLALVLAEEESGQVPLRLYNLNELYLKRYETTGNMSDLNKAVEGYKKALEDADGDPHIPRDDLLSCLGACLLARYHRLGESDVLEEAIKLCREAIEMTPSGHSTQNTKRSNLAACLADKSRYLRTNSPGVALQNLNEAIELGRVAIAESPIKRPDRFKWLMNMGVWLSWSYDQEGDPLVLDESITHLREAVKAAPPEHTMRDNCLSTLCHNLLSRHRLTRSTADREESINCGREAMNHMPTNHPERARVSGVLFRILKMKYEATEDLSVRDEALEIMREATMNETSYPSLRLHVVLESIPWLEAHEDWRDLSQVTETGLKILDQVSPRSTRQVDQQSLLRHYPGLAPTAAAAALQVGRSVEHALGLLEQGRGLITSLLIRNRHSTALLQEKHPNLAKKFEQLRDALDPPVATAVTNSAGTALSPEERYRAGEEFKEILAQIRRDDNFKSFLLPPKASELKTAAQPGETVVIINVSHFRCDAFLIRPEDVEVVSFPDVTHQEVEEAAQKFRHSGSRKAALKVLEWLWDAIAAPVLARLGADEDCNGRPYTEWSRVYWLPTGTLRLLPIHAAGYHNDGSHRTVMDRVISSYALSVEEIIHGRRVKAEMLQANPASPTPQQHQDAVSKVVLVSMETTHGSNRLPFAREEVQEVQRMLPAPIDCDTFDNPTREKLLRTMRNCTVFHFAGHGMTDSRDPSLSGLLLNDEDGRRAVPLTVRDLQALRFPQERPPLLAYLSACSTGRIDDEKLIDEGIHLMGACRLAGFRQVIGSLWEVSDRMCVRVATDIYRSLLETEFADVSVVHGLHDATRKLRAELQVQYDQEDRNAQKLAKPKQDGPPLWTAFIHMGV